MERVCWFGLGLGAEINTTKIARKIFINYYSYLVKFVSISWSMGELYSSELNITSLCFMLKVMTPNPECASIDTPIVDALHTMHDGKFLHLPVMDRGNAMVFKVLGTRKGFILNVCLSS